MRRPTTFGVKRGLQLLVLKFWTCQSFGKAEVASSLTIVYFAKKSSSHLKFILLK